MTLTPGERARLEDELVGYYGLPQHLLGEAIELLDERPELRDRLAEVVEELVVLDEGA